MKMLSSQFIALKVLSEKAIVAESILSTGKNRYYDLSIRKHSKSTTF